MENCIAIKFDKSRSSFKTERGSSKIYADDCNWCNVIIVEPYLLSNREATIIHDNKTFTTFGSLLNHIRVDTNKPFIILCSLKSFNGEGADCKDFKELNKLICEHIKKYGNSQYFFNSNIWLRLVEYTNNTNFLNEQFNRIKEEFEYFKKLGLYDLDSSKEVFEHGNRYFRHNYLKDIGNGGHANFITPKLYPNELAFADQILSINTTSISHEEIEKFHKATFRILLIDDKDRINVTNEKNEQKENKQEENKQEETSKAKIVAELLSAKALEPFVNEIVNEKEKKGHINQRLVWDTEKIEHYYFSTDDKKKNDYGEKFFDISNNQTSSNVQIVQVTNLTDAIVLLADHRIRFDLIMLDYLLDKKDENDNDRELATNFFLWFQDKHCENGEVEYLREKLMKLKVMGCEAIKDIICSQELNRLEKDYIKAENAEIQEKVLAKIKNVSMSEKQSFNRALRELVKGNRGPLKKFWFFPITAFNSTFIDDLVHNHVRLIDYYWHISKGADPITTPYTFLSLLNKFFYLQLENSVFLQSEIIRFLRSTITRLQEVNNYNDFVAVMGNDYASFVMKFMSRPNFCRDRATSLFSDYVWNEFYKKGEYETLHILVNYAHKFYHRCAFGTKDDYTKIVIFLRDMKMYIDEYFPDWNRRGDHYVDMARLSDIVDKCFGKQ